MNWLDMMDPQKRRAMEIAKQYEQQQLMRQMILPEMLQQQGLMNYGAMGPEAYAMPQANAPGYGVLKDAPMPMQAGQPGYGVLAPEANTSMNQAAASGAQGVDWGGAAMGLLSLAANLSGGDSAAPAPPPPPPGRPVGTDTSGLPTPKKRDEQIKRKRKYGR